MRQGLLRWRNLYYDAVIDRRRCVVPKKFQTDAANVSWVELYVACRRLAEGNKIAKEWIMLRWSGKGLA